MPNHRFLQGGSRSIAFVLQEHCFYYVGTRRAAFFPHFVLKAAARHPKGWRFQSEAGKESRATGVGKAKSNYATRRVPTLGQKKQTDLEFYSRVRLFLFDDYENV